MYDKGELRVEIMYLMFFMYLMFTPAFRVNKHSAGAPSEQLQQNELPRSCGLFLMLRSWISPYCAQLAKSVPNAAETHLVELAAVLWRLLQRLILVLLQKRASPTTCHRSPASTHAMIHVTEAHKDNQYYNPCSEVCHSSLPGNRDHR